MNFADNEERFGVFLEIFRDEAGVGNIHFAQTASATRSPEEARQRISAMAGRNASELAEIPLSFPGARPNPQISHARTGGIPLKPIRFKSGQGMQGGAIADFRNTPLLTPPVSDRKMRGKIFGGGIRSGAGVVVLCLAILAIFVKAPPGCCFSAFIRRRTGNPTLSTGTLGSDLALCAFFQTKSRMSKQWPAHSVSYGMDTAD